MDDPLQSNSYDLKKGSILYLIEGVTIYWMFVMDLLASNMMPYGTVPKKQLAKAQFPA